MAAAEMRGAKTVNAPAGTAVGLNEPGFTLMTMHGARKNPRRQWRGLWFVVIAFATLLVPSSAETSAETAAKSKADWWAFKPASRPPVPQVRASPSAILNPIDAFIRTRLAQEGLASSPEADRVTLLTG